MRAQPPGGVEPWFSARPRLALGISVVLFAAVFVLREVVHGAAEAVCLLYVLPIALVAFAFGRRAGAAAGMFGFGLFAVWALTGDQELSVVGWLARAVPMLLLGALVGGAADQQRRAAAAERDLLVAQLQARAAAEASDSIIQGLAAAKWAAEAGHHDQSIDVLAETVEAAQAKVSGLLPGRSVSS